MASDIAVAIRQGSLPAAHQCNSCKRTSKMSLRWFTGSNNYNALLLLKPKYVEKCNQINATPKSESLSDICSAYTCTCLTSNHIQTHRYFVCLGLELSDCRDRYTRGYTRVINSKCILIHQYFVFTKSCNSRGVID